MKLMQQSDARIWEMAYSLKLKWKDGKPISRKKLSRMMCTTHISGIKSHEAPLYKTINCFLQTFAAQKDDYVQKYGDEIGSEPPSFGGPLGGICSSNFIEYVQNRAENLPSIYVVPESVQTTR